jgi:hypothetical protein
MRSMMLTDVEVRTQVLAFLSTLDPPVSEASWKALGRRAGPILRDYVADASHFPADRAMAIDALAIVGGANAAKIFRDAANDDAEPFVVRFSAMRALATAAGPESSRDDLAALLARAREARIRAAAGEVLARRDAAASCPLVEAQLSRETADDQRYFRRALKSCRGE